MRPTSNMFVLHCVVRFARQDYGDAVFGHFVVTRKRKDEETDADLESVTDEEVEIPKQATAPVTPQDPPTSSQTSKSALTDDLDQSFGAVVRDIGTIKKQRGRAHSLNNPTEEKGKTISSTFRLRRRIIEAARMRDELQFPGLLKLLMAIPMTLLVLKVTGIGFLLTDRGYWNETTWSAVQKLERRWRTISKNAGMTAMDGHKAVVPQRHERPLAGY